MSKDWDPNLTPEQNYVLKQEGTESPGSSPLNQEKREGSYHCVGCGTKLFESRTQPKKIDRHSTSVIPFILNDSLISFFGSRSIITNYFNFLSNRFPIYSDFFINNWFFLVYALDVPFKIILSAIILKLYPPLIWPIVTTVLSNGLVFLLIIYLISYITFKNILNLKEKIFVNLKIPLI